MNQEQYRKVLELIQRQAELTERLIDELDTHSSNNNLSMSITIDSKQLHKDIEFELQFLNLDQE